MIDAALAETLSDTALDAEGAYQRIRALLELLYGCPPDYQLSAGLFVGLVESVRERMENVVDGLQAAIGSKVAA